MSDLAHRDSVLTLHVGNRQVELLHPGGSPNTTGDLIAWLPAEPCSLRLAAAVCHDRKTVCAVIRRKHSGGEQSSGPSEGPR